tara:strand:- start:994 stop:1113 length:120 start_codon:yes stop_codon:yes gene_type:complete
MKNEIEKPSDMTGFILIAIGLATFHAAALVAITIHELTK